jgi:hypothetical protein
MKTPREMAEYKLKLSNDFSRLGERLAQIKIERVDLWFKIREVVKSDKQADIKYEATPLGLEEMTTKLKMKCKEKEISAINTMFRVCENEARNQY